MRRQIYEFPQTEHIGVALTPEAPVEPVKMYIFFCAPLLLNVISV